MLKKTVLAVLLVLLLSSPALSGFMKANELLSDCENEATEENCLLYITGVVDTISIVVKSGALKQPYCLSDGIPVETLPPAVIEHLKDYPEKLDYEAPSVVTAALRKAFPCVE